MSTREAREQRILSLSGIVHKAAADSAIRRQIPDQLDDLVGYGWLGAIEAVDRYQDNSDASLATYAGHRIRGAILDALRSETGIRAGAPDPGGERTLIRSKPQFILGAIPDLPAGDRGELAHIENHDVISRILAALPWQQRQLLTAIYLQGISRASLAMARGASVDTIYLLNEKALRNARRVARGLPSEGAGARKCRPGGPPRRRRRVLAPLAVAQ